ncbi:MAG: glutamate-cysteine ligase family protein [Gemmatimonadota bacterium]
MPPITMADRKPTDRPGADFTRALLRDVRALERILAEGRVETGVRRIGAEQELILVNRARRPAPVGPEVLAELDDDRFSPELARFNLEVNLPPFRAGPAVLSRIERELTALVDRAQEVAARHGADVAMTGILPCLNQRDLTLENMTPRDRYRRLNEITMEMGGGRMLLHITGTDELRVEHDSVMLEACNTSFQVHLQVDPDEFARVYNTAQLVLAPRLWAETRIAVFRQSIDTRSLSPALRELRPRVRFGDAWVRDSVVELFEEDVVRFRSLMGVQPTEDPLAVLDAGGVPELGCLQAHNSTIYRWNRPCYGVTDGKAHLRIESRALPAGPTVRDEVANAALWLGLICAPGEPFGHIPDALPFDEAKANFFGAARRGLNTSFAWVGDERVPASRLVVDRLLPVAAQGLEALGVASDEAALYLDVIRARIEADLTGTRWLERSAQAMAGVATRPERCAALTAAMIRRQQSGQPVHTWELARIEDGMGTTGPTVDHYMTTSLLTVREDELVDLAAFIMDRERTRQILVEDDDFRLVGLISYRSLLKLLASGRIQELGRPVPVREVMTHDPVRIPPDMPVLDAIRLMKEEGVSSLPVVHDGKLVGILSERDFMPVAAELLERSFDRT